MATIGERIKEYRKKKHLTQKELSNLIHKTPQVISNYERGYSTPDSLVMKDIAAALDVSLDVLSANKNSQVKSKKKHVDLADDDVVMSYEGKPIPPEDLEIIRRFFSGGKNDK